MNPWQMAQQLKHELQQVTWPHGAQGRVFGDRSVYVYAGATPTDEEIPAAFPFAFVTIDSATPDADTPELIEQGFSLICACETSGDPLGEFAIIGSARKDPGVSAGAGVSEIASRVRAACGNLTGVDGSPVLVSATGTGSPGVIGRGRSIAFDTFTVRAMCSSQPFYRSPQQLRSAQGVWRWSSTPAERYDFSHYVLGSTIGASPVETPAQGVTTILYTGTAPQWTGTATGTVQVWAVYDGRRSGAQVYSDGRTVGAWRSA